MSFEVIENKVKDIIADQLGLTGDDVHPSASFSDDLGADALDFIELVMAFEEEFELDIDDDEADKFESVKDVIDFVSNRVN